jgi:hypothetical protein
MKSTLWLIAAPLGVILGIAALVSASHLGGGTKEAVAQSPQLMLDADVSDGGPCASIDSEITVAPGEAFQVGLCVRGITAPLANFQLNVIYDDTTISAPEIPLSDRALDDNPDANAGATTWGSGLGENWDCNILDLGQQPIGDNDPETGAGHGLATMACWSFGPWALGYDEDAGVLAVISFTAGPDQSGATSLELAEVGLGSSTAENLGTCNPAGPGPVIDCVGATVRVAGPTIAPEQWPTPTPVVGEIVRPTLGPVYTPPSTTVTPLVVGGSPEAATKTAEAQKNGTETPELTKTPSSSAGGEEEDEGGGTDWLWPTVIGLAAVVVVAGVALAVYRWRRGQAR